MNVNYHDKSKKHLLVEETCEDVPLRSGKWTHEEERYAASLIEHFESGKLTDCEEGETLRAYLSRKLHCIPMRVSKKYAGQCIGKVTSTYFSMTSVQRFGIETMITHIYIHFSTLSVSLMTLLNTFPCWPLCATTF
jgi:hypothetical protein